MDYVGYLFFSSRLMTIRFEPLIKKKTSNNLHRRHYHAISKQRRNVFDYPRVSQLTQESWSESRTGKKPSSFSKK